MAEPIQPAAECAPTDPAKSYDELWAQCDLERQIAKLSIVMIARDNAQSLMNIIPRLIGSCHEVVVLDTGSTDGTAPLCHEMGARVYQSVWRMDFSAARNEAMSHASGKWILSLDSDEVLTRDNLRLLNKVLAKADPEKDCFLVEIEMRNDAIPLEGNMNVQYLEFVPKK
jgi:glycosyltransferase involved in cell wall biosynthesis